MGELIKGEVAGVPYVVRSPTNRAPDAPIVMVWHLADAPRSAQAMAAAVPLEVVDAWRIYPTMPLCGDRLPPGGVKEIMRRGGEDAVRQLYDPMHSGGAKEMPLVLNGLREKFGLTSDRLAVVGGSSGAAVAQTVLAESGLTFRRRVADRAGGEVERSGRRHEQTIRRDVPVG